MTVICYRDGILASDSRCSDDSAMHFSNTRKVYRLKNGALVGTAGDSDARDVLAILAKASPRKMPSRSELANTKSSGSYLIVFPKGQLFTAEIAYIERDGDGEWAASVDSVPDNMCAVGHGYQFAYGAMEHGASAIEAVRHTCKRDTTCALPVQWESIQGRGNSDSATKAEQPVAPAKKVTKRR